MSSQFKLILFVLGVLFVGFFVSYLLNNSYIGVRTTTVVEPCEVRDGIDCGFNPQEDRGYEQRVIGFPFVHTRSRVDYKAPNSPRLLANETTRYHRVVLNYIILVSAFAALEIIAVLLIRKFQPFPWSWPNR